MESLHIDLGREMRGGQIQVLHLLQGIGPGAVLLARAGSPLLKSALERGFDAQPFSLSKLWALSRRANLVHAHDAKSHTYGVLVGHPRLVVSRRVAFAVGQGSLSKWKYSRARHFVAVSEYAKGCLVDAGVPRDRVSVVFDGVRLPPTISQGQELMALSSSDPMKGKDIVDDVSRALARPVHYSHNLEDDLPKASVFLYMTRSEGLGSAALLAMAHGVPVVASCVGGLPEVVTNGVTGLLVSSDVPEIVSAVRTVLARRDEMSLAARRAVQDRFLVSHMVGRTLDVYRRVLA